MYDELIKMLRVCGDSNNSSGNCPIRENDGSCPHGEWEFAAEKYMLQAADAIEELSAFREQITDGHFYCMRDGVLYEAKVEPPKGKVFQLPPIEFAEEES